MNMLALLQSDGGIAGTIIWFVIFFVFIFLYPRLMLSQIIYQLEKSASKLEKMSEKSVSNIAKSTSKKTKKSLKEKINNFLQFFVVMPSDLDPYGIVKKIDNTVRHMENRFENFTDTITSKDNQKINYALRAGVGLRQIAKIVRHYVELVKKYKNLQIAMVIKMQLPKIEEIAESEYKGVTAFMKGQPVGDSIGPLVAASLMDKSKEIAEDVVLCKRKLFGRNVYILKADGPDPHLGRTDEALEKVLDKHKISKVITVDAGLKLEGEDTGKVTEGIGFAMGGISQREIIENVLLPKKIPIDSVVVKVGMEEAILPMKKAIYEAKDKAVKKVKESIKREKKNKNIVVVGVGNSSGVGNTQRSVRDLDKTIDKIEKKLKKEKKKKEEGSWI